MYSFGSLIFEGLIFSNTVGVQVFGHNCNRGHFKKLSAFFVLRDCPFRFRSTHSLLADNQLWKQSGWHWSLLKMPKMMRATSSRIKRNARLIGFDPILGSPYYILNATEKGRMAKLLLAIRPYMNELIR